MKYWNYQNADVDKIGNMSQIAGIRHYEFKDGKAKGTEVMEIHTGSGLEFTVLAGRGMDIAWIAYRGVPLSYMSKTGIVSPSYYESGGMEWLHSFFAGGLTTCGLLNVGGPKKVEHPVIGLRDYGLHGRISNSAAEQVCVYEEWENGEYVMKISGLMCEAILHGEHLTMRREIATKYGSSEFTIRDVVTNRAAKPQQTKLLYHINFGYPLLDSGSRFIANSKTIIALVEEAKQEMDTVFACDAPVLDKTERCYAHDFYTDDQGNVKVAFVNEALELGVALEYSKDRLPWCNQWKMLNKKEYVIGIEPCTALPIETEQVDSETMGETILPGESKVYEITYKILDGQENIQKYENEIYGKE